MAEGTAKRVFEQPLDAISIYAEYVQVLGTENEVVIQFYDIVPGIPSVSEGVSEAKEIRTILRANVVMSPRLAERLTNILRNRFEKEKATAEGEQR